ncbi:MAG: lysophospholipid acyltransferase family protein [Bacteroidales bacterium]|nr:lysophospholipid acyltransferase family protein [Bacteroidales bacterium]
MHFFNKILTGLIWLVSKLPFPLLYAFSDFLYVVVYYIAGYRRKIVHTNLTKAFPDKTNAEIKKITKKFYKNFTDLIVEIIKVRSITKAQLFDRIKFENYELAERLFKKKQSIIVSIGHCGNWEWVTMVLEMMSDYKVYAVVKPLSSQYFEDYITTLRTKFSTKGGLMPFKSTLREMAKRKNELTMNIMAGDQTPTRDEINFRIKFLNQDTPVFLGIEKIAKLLNCAVVFFDIQREKRGYYKASIQLITENPKENTDNEITIKHTQMLEKAIFRNPDNWLWSHRRWKHQRKNDEKTE